MVFPQRSLLLSYPILYYIIYPIFYAIFHKTLLSATAKQQKYPLHKIPALP